MTLGHDLDGPHRDGLDGRGEQVRLPRLADDVAEPDLIVGHALKTGEVLDGIFLDRHAGLYLDGVKHAAVLDDQIDLPLLGVTVEPHVAEAPPRVHEALQHLRDDEGLEDVTRDRAVPQLVGRVPPGEMTDEARVHEVDKEDIVKIRNATPNFRYSHSIVAGGLGVTS